MKVILSEAKDLTVGTWLSRQPVEDQRSEDDPGQFENITGR
jgi:hypothetical protein